MNMLEIENISKRFGDKSVIKDLSLSVPNNCIFGFVGQNGAGKTTTMKMILGLLSVDSGQIYVHGEKVEYGQNRTNQYCGYLPDVPEFYNFMNAKEYLKFCADITEMQPSESKARSEMLLELVGLDKEKHRIGGYSRGMKQRLGIAQALLNQPKLLICDEPTSALDPIGRKEILDILITAKSQTTVLFSTHILSDVDRISDRIALLHGGKVVFSGNKDDLRRRKPAVGFEVELENPGAVDAILRLHTHAKRLDTLRVVFDTATEEQMHQAISLLIQEKIPFRKVEKSEYTLESMFMEVVGK
ncbi:MAG: ABC transporter ATP-binding protein [Clostridiaceae bacterium]|nr:ABC transporter ATP-binding protein [Clostridiaceae bacterium]